MGFVNKSVPSAPGALLPGLLVGFSPRRKTIIQSNQTAFCPSSDGMEKLGVFKNRRVAADRKLSVISVQVSH